MQFFKSENCFQVREALNPAGRQDLIRSAEVNSFGGLKGTRLRGPFSDYWRSVRRRMGILGVFLRANPLPSGPAP
jgi:hypothetical protein